MFHFCHALINITIITIFTVIIDYSKKYFNNPIDMILI